MSRTPSSKPRRSSSSGSSLWTVAGLGLGGYLLYSWFNKAQASPAAGTSGSGGFNVPGVSFVPSTLQPGVMTSTLTAVPAVTAAQVAQAQSFWSTLTPVAPPSSGYITFPSGSQVAATLMGSGNTAQDGNGNLYVLWAGQAFQLGAQDSAGNYPALPVSSNATPQGSGVLLSSATSTVPSSWLGL